MIASTFRILIRLLTRIIVFYFIEEFMEGARRLKDNAKRQRAGAISERKEEARKEAKLGLRNKRAAKEKKAAARNRFTAKNRKFNN